MDISALITALRNETVANSISPENVGYIMQRLLDLINSKVVFHSIDTYEYGRTYAEGTLLAHNKTLYIATTETSSVPSADNPDYVQASPAQADIAALAKIISTVDFDDIDNVRAANGNSSALFKVIKTVNLGTRLVGLLFCFNNPAGVKTCQVLLSSYRLSEDGGLLGVESDTPVLYYRYGGAAVATQWGVWQKATVTPDDLEDDSRRHARRIAALLQYLGLSETEDAESGVVDISGTISDGALPLDEVNQRLDELEAEMSDKNKEIGTLDISNINYANRTVTRMLGDKAVVKVTRSQGSLRVCVGVLIQFSDSMLHQLNQFFITSEIPNGDGEFDGGHTDTDCFVYFRSYGYTSAATPSGQWTQWRKLFDAADMSAFSQRLTAVEQTAQMKADMVVLSQSDYAAISNPDPDKFYFIYADDDQD